MTPVVTNPPPRAGSTGPGPQQRRGKDAGATKTPRRQALKKSELYSFLWASCDELRGGMDASQYKDYVLTLLFMKYVSDKYASDPDALLVVPEGGSFADMVRLKGDKEIGDKINKIIGRLAEANDLKGVIDVELDRPRDFEVLTTDRFTRYKDRALELIHEEAERAMEQADQGK